MIWWLWSLLLIQCSSTWGLSLEVSDRNVVVGQSVTVTCKDDPQHPEKYVVLKIFQGDKFDWGSLFNPQTYLKPDPEGMLSSNAEKAGVFNFQAYSTDIQKGPSKRDFPRPIAESDMITAVEASSSGKPSDQPPPTLAQESDISSTSPQTSTSSENPGSSPASRTIAIAKPLETPLSSASTGQSSNPPVSIALPTNTAVHVNGTPELSQSSSTSPFSLGSATSTPTSESSAPKDDRLRIILFSISGALILLILILVLFWIWRRRKYGNTLVLKNPDYFQSDALDKHFSIHSKSDWDATSLAPSDSISQAHFKVRSLHKKKPLAPSTALTALSEETESTVVPDLDESKSNFTKLGTELESESGGYGVSRTKVDFEHNNDRDSSTLLLPNPNIPIITKTPATPTPPSTVVTAS